MVAQDKPRKPSRNSNNLTEADSSAAAQNDIRTQPIRGRLSEKALTLLRGRITCSYIPVNLRDSLDIITEFEGGSCDIKVENLVDSSVVKKLDDSGFFEKIYAEYGVK